MCPLVVVTGKTGFLDGFAGILRNEPEKAMAPHSSTLAWKVPWMEEQEMALMFNS